MADNDLKIWQNILLLNSSHKVNAKFDLVSRSISHGNPAMPFTLLDFPVPKRRRIAWSEEIIAAVSASIQNEPNQSIPRRSQDLGIAQTTL